MSEARILELEAEFARVTRERDEMAAEARKIAGELGWARARLESARREVATWEHSSDYCTRLLDHCDAPGACRMHNEDDEWCPPCVCRTGTMRDLLGVGQ